MKYKLQPDGITARSTVQDVTMILATWAMAYGVVTIVGGSATWMIAPYRTALQVPYSPESWGVAIAILGALVMAAMFIGSEKLMTFSLLGCGIWNLFFVYSFLAEYIEVKFQGLDEPGVGLGPVVTYTLIAMLFLFRVSTYRSGNALQVHTP